MTTCSDSIRIVLADDHSLIREGTRHILEQAPGLTCVGEAADGRTALDLIERLRPDVAILDIRMPLLNGMEIVRQMQESSPATRALVLTAYDDDDYILALLEVGASGYLLKTTRAEDLADAVRKIHRGEAVLDPAILNKVTRFWVERRTSGSEASAQGLTAREQEVLSLAAACLRNQEIAARLSISVRTVEGHFRSIFNKLDVSSRLEAVRYAVSRNLAAFGDR